MASPVASELFPYARFAQIPRNGIIQLLDRPEIGATLDGCFVRVLLELQDHQEDYLLARIVGVEQGPEMYTGFSQAAHQYTNTVLRLQLPNALSGINGTLYQLNSISNSSMTEVEFEKWVHSVEREFALPTIPQLQLIAERIRPYTNKRQQQQQQQQQSGVAAPSTGAAVAQPQQPPLQSKPSMAARPVQGGGVPSETVISRDRKEGSPRGAAAAVEDDLPTRSQIHMQILNELRDKQAVFPSNISDLKSTQLRLAERDLIEYLDSVRNAISSKRSCCVVCMDQVASVIMLPCKHKVLCRFCAPSVSSCPCCRTLAVELFEPEEI